MLVADNFDWKNKTFKGEETHNTNTFLMQENTVLKDTERKGIVLQPERTIVYIKAQLLILLEENVNC